MKKVTVITAAVTLMFSTNLFAQNRSKIQSIYLSDTYYNSYLGEYNRYVSFYSTDIDEESIDNIDYVNTNKYSSDNLFDGSFNTCWVAGSYETKSYDTLYVEIPKKIDLNKVILNIFSGYGKSKSLYYKNARPKKIKLSIYAAYNPEGFVGLSGGTYFIKKYSEKFIEIEDTFGLQSFPLKLNKQKLIDFQKENVNKAKSSANAYAKTFLGDKNSDIKTADASFILKIEISDIYKGTKYDDICISELFFNNRFVTPSPLKYNKAENVYIKNDTILMADYADKKGVVIKKDTSVAFTMVDWIKNANFAVLHYVPNGEVGHGRTEEYYSLVDLKNRKIVDKEFERCTGHSPFFGIIEKKDEKVFINNIGNYSIELR